MSDAFPSLAALAASFRSGDMAPSAVTEAHLARIATHDPDIGAYQTVYAEDARRAAAAADKLFAAGYPLGPFHGIPFALKDICDLEGRVTTGGSKATADRISAKTGTLAQRLLDAGGILLGKTKTVERALGGWGTNQHMGTPRCPYDMKVHRVPGGSSSGTGAGVAAGLAVCGVGTDTGGSVRLPAAFCGITGLKVTEGVLPTDGIIPLAQLDTPGPMARSVEDTALMYCVMLGQTGAHIAAAHRDRKGVFAAMEAGMHGLRLGILTEEERVGATPEILSAYDHALDLLHDLGAELVPFQPDAPFAELTEACGRLICTEAYFHHGALYDRLDLPLDEDVRTRMFTGRGVLARDYLQMLEDRRTASRAFLTSLSGVDALLTPTTQMTAPALAEVDQTVMPSHFTRLANYFGLCALSLPIDLTGAGLPTSLQINCRPRDEALALRIGASFERARGAFPWPVLG